MYNFFRNNKITIFMFFVILIVLLCIINLLINRNTFAFNELTNEIQLNPDWIDYALKSEEEKLEYDVLPEKVIRMYSDDSKNNKNLFSKLFAKAEPEYPSSYNLKDDNLITGLKNQGSTSLCWAFAAVNSIESNALKNGISNYNKPLLFSERQIDYATGPANYIKEGISPYHEPFRTSLGVGGYASTAYTVFEAGVSPVTSDLFGDFNEDITSVKSLNEVLSINNVEYSVDSFESIGSVDSSTSDATRESWVKAIKKHIMNYGALSVNTIGPLPGYGGSCLYADGNGNYLINDDYNCNPVNTQNGHAMSIIGWDDNYTYKYCKKYNTTTSDLTNCSNVISGSGAFILKNSWGDNTSYPYLAYSSNAIGVMGVTSVSVKNWDNNYDSTNRLYDENAAYLNIETAINSNDVFIDNAKENIIESRALIDKSGSGRAGVDSKDYVVYGRNAKTKEVIKKISFSNNKINSKYDVYVANSLGNFNKVGEIIPDYYGVVSLDINNYELTNDYYFVKIVSGDDNVLDINVFTSYVGNDNNASATTFTKNDINAYLENGLDYTVLDESFYLSTSTTNIATGEYIYYQFLDKDNNDITSLFNVNKNVVLNNVVNPVVTTIGDILPAGKITVNTYYNNKLLDSNYFEINDVVNLWQAGDGSRNNPYIIYDIDDYNNIFKSDIYKRANYRLGNDLSLKDKKIISDDFYGTLNGNNYVIYDYEGSTPLFKELNNAIIFNLVISDFKLDVNSDSSFLVNKSFNSVFQNIKVINSNKIVGVSNKSYNIGSISASDYNSLFYDIANYADLSFNGSSQVGGVVGNCESCRIIESYNFGNISGDIAGGLAGYVNIDYDNVDNVPLILNSYNRGNISSTQYAGGLAGLLGNAYAVSSYNVNEMVEQTGRYGNFVGHGAYSYMQNVRTISNGGGFYGYNVGMNQQNIASYTSEEMQDKENYSGFDFSSIWELDLNNNSVVGSDYPYLKFNNFVKVNDISISDKVNVVLNKTVRLSSDDIVINPVNASVKSLRFLDFDSDIISVSESGVIKGLKIGNTSIKVKTLDGSNKSALINVEVIEGLYDLSNYDIIEDSYLKVKSLITAENFENKLMKNVSSVRFDIVANHNNIATGDRFNIYDGNRLVDSYLVSVLGDITGTGTINVSDVAKLFQYVQGVKGMDRVYQIAGDVKNDNELRVNDVAKLFQYVQGKRERLDD